MAFETRAAELSFICARPVRFRKMFLLETVLRRRVPVFSSASAFMSWMIGAVQSRL